MTSAVPSLAELHGRRRAVAERQAASAARVSALAARHATLGAQLDTGIAALQRCSDALSATAQPPATGLGFLLRPFTARRASIARKSAAEELYRQYEAVSVRLREALAFTDELQAAAVELQEEVEALHRARHDAGVARGRLERAVAEATAAAEATSPEDGLRREQLAFTIRSDTQALERVALANRMADEHMEPARKLRDTAMTLHEHMAGYVASAGRVVDRAAGRVAVVGLLADAAGVVADLHGSVRDLEAALDAAERYVADSRVLLGRILPELAAELERRETGDPALRALAEAEVEAALAAR